MTDAGIELTDVSVVFPTATGPLTAVTEVTQAVPDRSFVSIVGPSGCGKSTLLSVIAGLQEATTGMVRIGGQPVTKPRPDVGFVFQEDSMLPWRTVADNVRFAMQMTGVDKSTQQARTQEAIELVGLQGFEKAYPATLSGGMRQRVALARTLALQPDVVLLDEPFAALDQQTRVFLGAEVRQIWARTHQTVVCVTHDIAEAIMLSEQVWVMSFRPGTIIDVIDVTLEGEREPSIVASDEFNALRNRVWAAVQAEALRGFEQRKKSG